MLCQKRAPRLGRAVHTLKLDQGTATRAAGHWKQGHCSAQRGGGSGSGSKGTSARAARLGQGTTRLNQGSRMMTEAHCSGWSAAGE